ncbi:putative thymidylate synthase [Durotheca rogersii]|uniref:putative thymidylate synthase n=1 Tax=Durotheca rogersii TaxID=419775 RepID=UPI002220A83B|nr:putative thymidylate synthase [Durotheca rogersii]KAI5864738.1 putative thymidylate synthase [Durotheca rogersii]
MHLGCVSCLVVPRLCRGKPTIHLPLWISSLADCPDLSICVIPTENAARFLAGQSREQPPSPPSPTADSVRRDEDERSEPWDNDPASGKRILVAPSMNTFTRTQPATAQQLPTLTHARGVAGADARAGWYEVLLPQSSKALACGDVGQGGMCDWEDIGDVIRERLALPPKSLVVPGESKDTS